MKIWWIKYIVALSSAILLGMGFAAFFVPQQLALLIYNQPTQELFIQLYGATLIGFGFANWYIRHAPAGGIYGRAIVSGNIIHFLSGSGLLMGFILGGDRSTSIILLFTVYLLLAVSFIAVLFSGGIRKAE